MLQTPAPEAEPDCRCHLDSARPGVAPPANEPFSPARSDSAPPARHPFDAALAAVRTLADTYYPQSRRVVVVIVPGAAEAAFTPPPGATCFDVPPAWVIPAPPRCEPEGKPPRLGSDYAPVRRVQSPGCTKAVLKVLYSTDSAMTAPEIYEALRANYERYSTSAVEKACCELVSIGVLKNNTTLPKGYRFVGD